MSTVHNAPKSSLSEVDDEGIGIIDLMIVLAKYKKWILTVPLLVALSAAVVSFVLPNVYKAGTNILPPQQAQSGAAMLLSQLGGMAGAAAGAAGIKNPNDLYVGMLKSRTLADRLIVKFDLKKYYDTTSMEIARRKLETNTNVSSGKDGLITIEVESEDQKMVAKLANAYVDELFQLTKTLAVTEASQRRVFFERQLLLAKNNLANAEVQLKGSLDSGGVASVDTESRAMLETAARVRAQVSAKEIQLNSMRSFLTGNHPDFKRTEEELASLREELRNLESGRVSDPLKKDNASRNEAAFGNIKLLRDVKYYQMLYELLAKQYEVARLDEAKEPSIIQVLDLAVEPEHKFKPKRFLIVFISTIFALLLTIAFVLALDAKRRMTQSSIGAAKWNELKRNFKLK
jgi:uncharacterized protein involved in exopolysaccharide biosynthesis